ncbi:MAG: NUDIX domain-containing protein [Planctomycetia bacterium]|nr:NUDIX domain-containing protein [Planctomycetia bacterium]
MLEIAIAVVEQAGQVLIGPRPAGAHLAGLWEFPGGKMGERETPRAAAVRECQEETGLVVDVVGTHAVVEHRYPATADQPATSLRLHFIACQPRDPAAVPSEPFRWVSTSELDRYEFPAANAAVVALLRGTE